MDPELPSVPLAQVFERTKPAGVADWVLPSSSMCRRGAKGAASQFGRLFAASASAVGQARRPELAREMDADHG